MVVGGAASVMAVVVAGPATIVVASVVASAISKNKMY